MSVSRLSLDGYGARRAGSFAGRAEVVAVPTVVVDQSLGGKPEKKKKRRKSLYDDVENNTRFEVPVSAEAIERNLQPESVNDVPAAPRTEIVAGLTAMAEAFQKAGIRTSEQFIQEQESIDRRRNLNLAAIILLLD